MQFGKQKPISMKPSEPGQIISSVMVMDRCIIFFRFGFDKFQKVNRPKIRKSLQYCLQAVFKGIFLCRTILQIVPGCLNVIRERLEKSFYGDYKKIKPLRPIPEAFEYQLLPITYLPARHHRHRLYCPDVHVPHPEQKCIRRVRLRQSEALRLPPAFLMPDTSPSFVIRLL